MKRMERALGHQKARELTVGLGEPHPSEGSEGDLTFRKVATGMAFFIKYGSIWYDINELKPSTITWHDPDMLNCWERYDTDHNPPQYAKDSNGFVHLRGLIGSGSSASADMFELPVGFRPAYVSIFPGVAYNSVFCRINVGADGDVSALVSGSTTWTCLDGIVFHAAR